MHHFDWFNHGGLFREVDLVPLPRLFIRDSRLSWCRTGGSPPSRFACACPDPVSGDATSRSPSSDLTVPVTINDGKAAPSLTAPPGTLVAGNAASV